MKIDTSHPTIEKNRYAFRVEASIGETNRRPFTIFGTTAADIQPQNCNTF